MNTKAHGIHVHATKKLGARPEDRNKVKILLEDHLLAIPDHPVTDASPSLTFGMDENDNAGDCVVAGADHTLEVSYALFGETYTSWTDDQILAYYQTQNPGMKSWADAGTDADGGMIVAQFLSYLVKQGVILGYAKVNHLNPEIFKAAVYLGGAIITASTLQKAQQEGDVWDYVPGSPEWGGHCTANDGYDPTQYNTISWGSDRYLMTQGFISHCMSEAYLLVTKPMVDHPEVRKYLNLSSFAAAYQQLTGSQFPVPVPSPNPTPGPTPTTGGTIEVSTEIINHITNSAKRAGLGIGEWTDQHFNKWFKIVK